MVQKFDETMDEIDNVVNNLFGQYIGKSKEVAAPPSEPLPSTAPEHDPHDNTLQRTHPDIIVTPAMPHSDIIVAPAAPKPKTRIAAKGTAPKPKAKAEEKVTAVKAQKTATAKKSEKKSADVMAVPVDIADIKKQTAKMLRHLQKAIKAKNWWHRLYYANKFLLIAGTISKTITRRDK